MKLADDKHIVQAIISGSPKERTNALEIVYDLAFLQVEKFVINNRGTNQNAKDIFQDGVVALYENLRDGKFNGSSSLKTYLYAICRNMWLRHLKKINIEFEKIDDIKASEPTSTDEEVNIELLRVVFSELKEGCNKLLKAYYYDQLSMKQIQQLFGLGSEQAAKTKKLRCMKYLQALIKEKGLTYENFLN